MKGRKKAKLLKAGEIASYKFPAIKGLEGENFYRWLNSYEKHGYRSLNSLITESLKLRFMMDTLITNNGAAVPMNNAADSTRKAADNHIFDVDEIEIEELKGLPSIEKTFGSIKR